MYGCVYSSCMQIPLCAIKHKHVSQKNVIKYSMYLLPYDTNIRITNTRMNVFYYTGSQCTLLPDKNEHNTAFYLVVSNDSGWQTTSGRGKFASSLGVGCTHTYKHEYMICLCVSVLYDT